ncbi:MAG: glycosyltransferase family 39 protein [Lacibacter sp.]|nr:glycosyltransferase family 39 protein [Lacibacter sp.]
MADDSKMPIIAFNLLPRIAQQFLNKDLKKTDQGYSDIVSGRYITLFFSIGTLLIVFVWVSRLYGSMSALIATFMLSFCPNNLAAASLVTTDSYSVFILTLILFLLWNWLQKGSLKHFIFLSVAIAIAQVIKQSLFHLYILVPVLLLVFYIVNRPQIRISKLLFFLGVFTFIQLIIINSVYFFSGSFSTIGSYQFVSHGFKNIQQLMPVNLPVPLPSPFVQGLDFAIYVNDIGGGVNGVSGFGKITILGNEATQGRFWYYYLVSLLFKTPITCILLFLFAIMRLLKSQQRKQFFKNEWLLLGTFIYFFTYFSFFYKTQIGIRQIIFLYPIMFILSVSFVSSIRSGFQKYLLGILLIYQAVSVLTYAKNYYPYTNEFIVDKKMAYAVVGAANLEFGQGAYFATNYLKNNAGVSFPKETPQNGVFLVSTSDYLDIWNIKKYSWLQKYKPFDHVAYNWLLIRVADLP